MKMSIKRTIGVAFLFLICFWIYVFLESPSPKSVDPELKKISDQARSYDSHCEQTMKDIETKLVGEGNQQHLPGWSSTMEAYSRVKAVFRNEDGLDSFMDRIEKGEFENSSIDPRSLGIFTLTQFKRNCDTYAYLKTMSWLTRPGSLDLKKINTDKKFKAELRDFLIFKSSRSRHFLTTSINEININRIIGAGIFKADEDEYSRFLSEREKLRSLAKGHVDKVKDLFLPGMSADIFSQILRAPVTLIARQLKDSFPERFMANRSTAETFIRDVISSEIRMSKESSQHQIEFLKKLK